MIQMAPQSFVVSDNRMKRPRNCRSSIEARTALSLQPITKQQIDPLLPFLDRFEPVGSSAGDWKNPPKQMPWFDFDETVRDRAGPLR